MKFFGLIAVMMAVSKQQLLYEYHSALDLDGKLHYREKKLGEEETSGIKEVEDITKLKEYREWHGDKWREKEVDVKNKNKKQTQEQDPNK